MKKETIILKQALLAAARVVKKHFGKVGYELKAKANLVTKADLASQKTILNIIRKNFPHHDYLAEEDAKKITGAPYIWVIDPIDGTTNFAHTVPQCSISIALFHKNEPVLGGVINPITGDLFFAQKGKGATLNGKKIHVSRIAKMENSLLVTGFPYNRFERMPELLNWFERFLLACHDVRRFGSAALDLCWLAAGRLEGYWEDNLNPWDVGAGLLIVQEAGGKVTDFSGKKYKKLADMGRSVLASNGKIHAQMVKILKTRPS
jgi:myo-inositol-1(or 4)-monophosphatase